MVGTGLVWVDHTQFRPRNLHRKLVTNRSVISLTAVPGGLALSGSSPRAPATGMASKLM